MSITEEEVLKIGKTTDAIKIPSQFGGGYMASVEVNHQLHCLVSPPTAFQFSLRPHSYRLYTEFSSQIPRPRLLCATFTSRLGRVYRSSFHDRDASRSLHRNAAPVRHVSRGCGHDYAPLGQGLSPSVSRLQHMASVPEFWRCVAMDEGQAVQGGKWGPARGMEVCACRRRSDIGRTALGWRTSFCKNERRRNPWPLHCCFYLARRVSGKP